jgi:O-methyltransferase
MEPRPKQAQKGLAERTKVVGGDFFQSVPSADLYLLKMILHDWDDESCIRILKNCRAAMTSGGRIAVVEMIVGELSDPGPAAFDGHEYAGCGSWSGTLSHGV